MPLPKKLELQPAFPYNEADENIQHTRKINELIDWCAKTQERNEEAIRYLARMSERIDHDEYQNELKIDEILTQDKE